MIAEREREAGVPECEGREGRAERERREREEGGETSIPLTLWILVLETNTYEQSVCVQYQDLES
jgi:hypothetical protein